MKGEKNKEDQASEPGDQPAPDREEHFLTVGGSTRTYRLHLPVGRQPGEWLPLVVMLHGGDMTGAQMERMETGQVEDITAHALAATA